MLQPYAPYSRIDTPPNPRVYNVRQIVMKLAQGTAIRLDGRFLAANFEPAPPERVQQLTRMGLTLAQVVSDVVALNAAVRLAGGVIGRAAPNLPTLDLERLRTRAEQMSGIEMPDLNLFFFIHLPADANPITAAALLELIRATRTVETAYFQPVPVDSQPVDRPPATTIDVTPSQGYLMQAPTGIDVNLIRKMRGGDGRGIRIADIEAGWTDTHEDFPAMSFRIGVNWGSEHGSAVLGELVAGRNGFGADGIVPSAEIGWSSITNVDILMGNVYFYSVAGALLTAGQVLRQGDIALIEQHFPNFLAGPCPNMCNCGQFGYVAVETFPFEHAAISTMTRAGIIVIEAAGNGQTLVTPASSLDSGAIVVGASDANLVPSCFTNFGPRVNVHAWGAFVATTGYGGAGSTADPTLRANGPDPTQWYTTSFAGTSSASPIVTGAAAAIQSIRLARGLQLLTPFEMRTLLVSTGTPQAAGTNPPNIGPLPDLNGALATFIPDSASFVAQSGAPLTLLPGQTFTLITDFDNAGSRRWTGGHNVYVAPSSATGQQDFSGPRLQQGTTNTPIMPGERASAVMQVRGPSQPGTYRLTVNLEDPGGVVLARSNSATVTVAPQNTPFDNAQIVIDSAPNSMRDGETGTVTVTVTNIGTTNWTTLDYSLRLSRISPISLPRFSASLTSSVAPGQSQTISFQVICNGTSSGGWGANMASSQALLFGQSAGRGVFCQP